MFLFKRTLTCLCLLFTCLFLSVGYAKISTNLAITSEVESAPPNILFIYSVSEISINNAVLESESHVQTALVTNSKYNSSSSSIVLEITFFNGSDLIYEYSGIEQATHSTSNVSYVLTKLALKQKIEPKSFCTATLTFTSKAQASLASAINFKFVVANTEENVGASNHHSLVDAMINDPTEGLNNPKSYLNEQITFRKNRNPSRDTLGSMAVDQGESLEEKFGDSYATNEKLAYLIQFKNENGVDYYYIFTTSVVLGEKTGFPYLGSGKQNIPLETPVYQVFRTKVVYDTVHQKWVSEETVLGYAPSAYYEESQPNSSIHLSKIPAFDPDTWVEGTIGNSFNDAVYTSTKQTSSTSFDSKFSTDIRYLKIDIPRRSSYKIEITNSDSNASGVLIQVYNSSQTLITSGHGVATISNTSSSTVTYYIALSGSAKIQYKITAA